MGGRSVWANMSYKSNLNIEEMRQSPQLAMSQAKQERKTVWRPIRNVIQN